MCLRAYAKVSVYFPGCICVFGVVCVCTCAHVYYRMCILWFAEYVYVVVHVSTLTGVTTSPASGGVCVSHPHVHRKRFLSFAGHVDKAKKCYKGGGGQNLSPC